MCTSKATGAALAVALSAAGAGSGCAARPWSSRPLQPANINHVVLVALKDDAERAELVRDCCTWPSDIGIQNAWVGRPTEGERPQVDHGFTVAFVVAFQTQADYDRYQSSAWHAGMLKKWAPRCASLRIFDIGRDPIESIR